MILDKQQLTNYLEYLNNFAKEKRRNGNLEPEDFHQLYNEYEKFKEVVRTSFGLPSAYKELVKGYDLHRPSNSWHNLKRILGYYFINEDNNPKKALNRLISFQDHISLLYEKAEQL